jgi:hypothetical protein
MPFPLQSARVAFHVFGSINTIANRSDRSLFEQFGSSSAYGAADEYNDCPNRKDQTTLSRQLGEDWQDSD